jgi:hypothetical protein
VADPIQAMELIKREYNHINFVVSNFEMGVDTALLRLLRGKPRHQTSDSIQNTSRIVQTIKGGSEALKDPGSRGICLPQQHSTGPSIAERTAAREA